MALYSGRADPTTVTALVLWAILSPRPASADSNDYWKARLEVVVFDFGEAVEEIPGPRRLFHKAVRVGYTYDVYQSPLEVVRRQVINQTSKQASEGDRGTQLIDYRRGSVTTLLHGEKAVRFPLIPPGAATTELDDRRILGLNCKGTQIAYQDGNRFRHVRQAWVPAGSSFKDYVLEIAYIYNPDGSVAEVSLGVTTMLERVSPLDPALFELPPGLEVVDVAP